MKTKEQIKVVALRAACLYLFTNVDDDGWPETCEEALAMLKRGEDVNDDYCLYFSEPYAEWPAKDMYDELEHLAREFELVMLWAQGEEE